MCRRRAVMNVYSWTYGGFRKRRTCAISGVLLHRSWPNAKVTETAERKRIQMISHENSNPVGSRDWLARSVLGAACFAISMIVIAPVLARPTRSAAGQRMEISQDALIAQRVATLRRVSEVFRATAAEPLPSDLSAQELTEAKSYTAWLRDWADRLDTLAATGAGVAGGTDPITAAAGGGGNSQDALLAATKNMQETQMSFNLQYLQLQSSMQNEHRRFTMVSNVLKTRHDIVKSSISDIR
jgi:hypothetical protein